MFKLMPPAYITVILLMIALAVCTCRRRGALYILSALTWLGILPLFIFIYKTDLLNTIMPILIFNGYLLGIGIYANSIEKMKKKLSLALKENEIIMQERSREFASLMNRENEMREKEIKTVSLYEVTKQMSSSLKFDDIFNILGNFMKDNFSFRKCELAILKEMPEGLAAQKTYGVWRGRKASDYDYKINYDRLIRILAEKTGPIYLEKDSDSGRFKDLGVEDDEVNEFAAIPLFSEKRLVAVLSVDNLPEADIEKFIILASQFALEIKKVILYETVENLAITDSLTGLFVRRHFLERLNEELFRSKRYKFKFAFLMVDIDNFKECNDTYGHLVGDVILKEMARIMKESVREIDLVSRYGGEEFALVLPETGRDGAMLVAERIRKKINDNVFKAYDERLHMSVSIGVAIYPEDSREMKELIEKADAALYVAKKSGKNIVCEYKK